MEWFDRGVMLFGCILEIFLLFDYFRNFFEQKLSAKGTLFVFLAACFALFGINMVGNATINLVFIPFILWTFVSLLFECSFGIRIGYFVIAYIVMIGVEFLFLILSHTTVEMITKTGVVPVSDYGWQIVVIKFINYLAFLILKQTSHKSHSKMENKLFFVYLCVPIASLGLMIIIFYSGVDFAGNEILNITVTLFFVFMVLGNMVLFYVFQKHTEDISEFARQEVELVYKNAEIERLAKITEMNDEYRETVHNMTHSLKVIEQLAMEHNVEKIQEIVESIIGKLIQREIYEYSHRRMVNTILSEYKEKADKQKIQFYIYVEPGCIIEQIPDIDLVSLLGNILDNAFEAAGETDDSLVTFRMFMHDKGKMCVIKVVNSYGKEIIVKNGVLRTTKKEKGFHGIGIRSIGKTAEKYKGSFSYYTEDQKFYATLILPIE